MRPDEQTFQHIVVIGASAGGVDSLSVLVSTLPHDFPAPVVVAQHLSPSRASALGDILARRGPLPVRTITDAEVLEPGVIYVVPPNRDVTIDGEELHLQGDGDGPRPSIDLLFSSAAAAFGERVIAVVLSGTGSDGAIGAREVKYAGGTVVIQDPETAAYPGMPLSLAPSVVDIVASRDRIGDVLLELVRGEVVVPPAMPATPLHLLLEELRDQSGIDFTTYKQSTIARRLHRRMTATGQRAMQDYIRYVRQHPEERQRLVNSFLIKVTEFFRDPALYRYLREQVLPELLTEARQHGGELRIWSAGCATGEEAYSLGMTVLDVAEAHDGVRIRIFATDLDEEAVAFARRGIYPARALATIPDGMVERYFLPHGEDYEVRKNLRGLLVFGEHDLAQRAPFSRIDLVLCRNVLIYFTAALQRRALQLFAFSLRPGGYLVLGKSESVSPLAEYFATDQPRLKVFRRVGSRAMIPTSRSPEMETTQAAPEAVEAATSRAPQPAPRVAPRAGRAVSRRGSAWAGERVARLLPYGLVIVDRRYDIHSINAEARRIFGVHTSALDQDLIHLVQFFNPIEVRKVVDETFVTGAPVRRLLTTSESPEVAEQAIEVISTPMSRGDDSDEVIALVTILDVTEREQLRQRQASAEEAKARLVKANDEVLAANEELTMAISRLRAENEELLVASEEIQAATEEVETLNEELQASNEELETLNEELQATVEELDTTNDDLHARSVELQALAIQNQHARDQLHAILDAEDDAVIVVDEQGTVLLENSAYAAIHPDGIPGVMLDAQGQPLAAEALPGMRAARGERFSAQVGVQRDGAVAWFEAQGREVTMENGERLGIVRIRPADR